MRSGFWAGLIILFLIGSSSCSLVSQSKTASQEAGTKPAAGGVFKGGVTTPRPIEGQDFVVLERVRFIDQQGVVPVTEAFSVLLPRGWKSEGGVIWKNPFACMGEMLVSHMKAASPDGAIQYTALPTHAWAAASDPMMLQNLQMQARQGGCEVRGQSSAERYFRDVMIPRELPGVTIVEVRENREAKQALSANQEKAVAEMRARGGMIDIQPDAILARLKWPGGEEGIALCSVVNSVITMQNAFNGAAQQLSLGYSSERSWVKFPAKRRDEAERLLMAIRMGFRTNPEWQKNVDQFNERFRAQRDMDHARVMNDIQRQTEANLRAHEQRMAQIQLQGAAGTAAHNDRMAAMDQNMRSWEARQNSNDQMHRSYVQAIREVETWRGADGGQVELTAGYEQAWSRGNGSYLLSNKPGFDPTTVFQDQRWEPMKREK